MKMVSQFQFSNVRFLTYMLKIQAQINNVKYFNDTSAPKLLTTTNIDKNNSTKQKNIIKGRGARGFI